MKFCDLCENWLRPIYKDGSVLFKCDVCEKDFEGTDDDRLICTVDNLVTDSSEMYESIIATLDKDITAKNIKKQCPKCPMDFMKVGRFGKDENVVVKCINCKHTEKRNKLY